MILRSNPLAGFVLLLVSGTLLAEQPADAVHYVGSIGQQPVSLSLQWSGQAVVGGSYSYVRQKSEIRIVDSRQFGTTVVLQDEDGNILHLHFEDASGEKTGSFAAAAMLEGTLDRGELDLPVKLSRAEHDIRNEK